MKKEDLRNTKIYLSNREDRDRFKHKVYSLGLVKPVTTRDKFVFADYAFFYIDNDYILHYSSEEDGEFFINAKQKQIFLDDVMKIEKNSNSKKEQYNFKPFDKVLMRDSKTSIWSAKLFSHMSASNAPYPTPHPYNSIDEVAFKYCIPFKDNEHLHNTSYSNM